jgi:hypothetical protein
MVRSIKKSQTFKSKKTLNKRVIKKSKKPLLTKRKSKRSTIKKMRGGLPDDRVKVVINGFGKVRTYDNVDPFQKTLEELRAQFVSDIGDDPSYVENMVFKIISIGDRPYTLNRPNDNIGYDSTIRHYKRSLVTILGGGTNITFEAQYVANTGNTGTEPQAIRPVDNTATATGPATRPVDNTATAPVVTQPPGATR